MKRFVCLFALLALLSAPAAALGDASTYVFPYDGVRYTAAEGETVLTQDNLVEHESFLSAQGTTPETVRAGYIAAQTVLESYSSAGQVSLSIGQCDEFRMDASVARMDDDRRAQFLASFADSGLYEQASWSPQNSEYVRLTYSAMYADVPVYFLSYVTLRHGQLYRFTATVAARDLTAADDDAVLDVIARTEYLGQLATPAPSPSPTPEPTPTPTPRPTPGVAEMTQETQGLTLLVDSIPAWTDESELTVTGTSVADARVTISVNGKEASKATVARDGSFKLRAQLEEGVNEITLSATLKGEETAEKSYTLSYEMPTLTVEITEPLGYVESATSTLRGVTAPRATVYIRGEGVNTNVRANNDGNFTLQLKHAKAGDFTYTITAKLDGYHDGETQFTLTRVLSYAEELAAFKSGLSDISYDRLLKAPADFKDKKISLRGRISAFSDYEGMPCLLLYSKNPGKGQWTQPVWILCEEILSFEEGDIITVLGVVEGTQLPFTDEQGAQSQLPVVRMKFYVE